MWKLELFCWQPCLFSTAALESRCCVENEHKVIKGFLCTHVLCMCAFLTMAWVCVCEVKALNIVVLFVVCEREITPTISSFINICQGDRGRITQARTYLTKKH